MSIYLLTIFNITCTFYSFNNTALGTHVDFLPERDPDACVVIDGIHDCTHDSQTVKIRSSAAAVASNYFAWQVSFGQNHRVHPFHMFVPMSSLNCDSITMSD